MDAALRNPVLQDMLDANGLLRLAQVSRSCRDAVDEPEVWRRQLARRLLVPVDQVPHHLPVPEACAEAGDGRPRIPQHYKTLCRALAVFERAATRPREETAARTAQWRQLEAYLAEHAPEVLTLADDLAEAARRHDRACAQAHPWLSDEARAAARDALACISTVRLAQFVRLVTVPVRFLAEEATLLRDRHGAPELQTIGLHLGLWTVTVAFWIPFIAGWGVVLSCQHACDVWQGRRAAARDRDAFRQAHTLHAALRAHRLAQAGVPEG